MYGWAEGADEAPLAETVLIAAHAVKGPGIV
jgi:hypothetical protein